MASKSAAFLSNSGDLSCFSFGAYNIRFRTPRNLERYLDVIEWDHGYLVVNARYRGMPDTEEYIDLVPILQNLYIDPDWFLEPIKSVEVNYA